MDKLINQIKNTLAMVFNVDVYEIEDDCAYGVFHRWDSVAHMNLILALEEEFDMRFLDDEVADMLNFNLIHSIIKSKI